MDGIIGKWFKLESIEEITHVMQNGNTHACAYVGQ